MSRNIERKVKVGAKELEIEEMCFPVEIHANPRKTNKEYSMVVTGIINDEEMDLNYCSNVYTLIKNENIFPKIEQILFNNAIDFEVKYSHINHVRFYADYKINDKRYAYLMKGTNDLIYPMIRVQHSYNGLTKYGILFGYYRLVCGNGMVIGVEEMKEFNLSIIGKHTDVILHSFDRLNNMLVYFSLEAKKITNKIVLKYELLANNWIDNPLKRVETILNANKIAIVNNSKTNTLNNIISRIMHEANMQTLGYNGKVNDFLIYNGINQYLNDDNVNIAIPEVRQEKDLKIFEYMLVN